MTALTEPLHTPSDCPSWYDGCHCRGRIAQLERKLAAALADVVNLAAEETELTARIIELEAEVQP